MVSALSNGSAVATIAFGNVHIRVYWQDKDNYIRESRWEHGWSGGTESDRVFLAKPGTPLAAVNWNDNVRIYYVDTDNILQEGCLDDKTWYHGNLGTTTRVEVNEISKLAATWTPGKDAHYIKVYYQGPDDVRPQQARFDGQGWSINSFITMKMSGLFDITPIWGTGLATYSFGKQNRLYWQGNQSSIFEYSWNEDDDTVGILNLTMDDTFKGKLRTAIAITSWSNHSHKRLYYNSPEGKIFEIVSNTGDKSVWEKEINEVCSGLEGTSLSAFNFTRDSRTQLRLYLQQQPDNIKEYCGTVEDEGENWGPGAVVPTA